MTPSDAPSEHQALLRALGGPRRHVFDALDGLDDEQLRRPVLPSGWNCLGLVNHLALDVEHFWFQVVALGDPKAIGEVLGSSHNAWIVEADVPAEAVLGGYRRQIERADTIIASTSLDSAPAWWPEEQFGSWRLSTVREIVLHVLAETAAHAGHLDAVRELIDGTLHLVLTD